MSVLQDCFFEPPNASDSCVATDLCGTNLPPDTISQVSNIFCVIWTLCEIGKKVPDYAQIRIRLPLDYKL